MDLNELHTAFIEHLKAKNYSPSTIVAYSSHLEIYLDHLRATGISDIRGVSQDGVKKYLLKLVEQKNAGLEGKGYANATISIKIRAVKRFFQYLETSGQILINPAELIKEPRKDTSLPRTVLTDDEVRKILEQPRLNHDFGIRDRAVLEVFYSTGIRLEEMTRLTVFDCDLQGGLLRVNKGKGSKDRLIPLGKYSVAILRKYIAHVRPRYHDVAKAGKALFLNRFGQPLSKQMIEIFVRNYARKAGIIKKVTPHAFRHTFATDLVRNGADIAAVRKMLGHSGLRTTQIYIKVAVKDVKTTHGRHHPRERDNAETEVVLPAIKEQHSP